MSYILSIILGVLVLFCSCSDVRNANDRRPIGDELTIRMERKGCYGQCPVYDLNIQQNGDVTFEGKGYTTTIGTVESKVTQEQLQELISEIRNNDFFAFRNAYETGADSCPTTVTDMPTVILTVRLDGREKTVSHYHGCLESSELQPAEPGMVHRAEKLHPFPRKLTTLEDRVDEIVMTKRWIGDGSN